MSGIGASSIGIGATGSEYDPKQIYAGRYNWKSGATHDPLFDAILASGGDPQALAEYLSSGTIPTGLSTSSSSETSPVSTATYPEVSAPEFDSEDDFDAADALAETLDIYDDPVEDNPSATEAIEEESSDNPYLDAFSPIDSGEADNNDDITDNINLFDTPGADPSGDVDDIGDAFNNAFNDSLDPERISDPNPLDPSGNSINNDGTNGNFWDNLFNVNPNPGVNDPASPDAVPGIDGSSNNDNGSAFDSFNNFDSLDSGDEAISDAFSNSPALDDSASSAGGGETQFAGDSGGRAIADAFGSFKPGKIANNPFALT